MERTAPLESAKRNPLIRPRAFRGADGHSRQRRGSGTDFALREPRRIPHPASGWGRCFSPPGTEACASGRPADVARFCPDCLRADADGFSGVAEGASRLRWAWLMRPVVACPVHNVRLTELAAPDPVNAFDLPGLFAQHDVELADIASTEVLTPGPLQRYVVDRMTTGGAGSAWLDGQDIAPAVKARDAGRVDRGWAERAGDNLYRGGVGAGGRYRVRSLFLRSR
ncbi:TniQ family protein [Pseudorhodobacter antarcticus]|uniref:TniQ family protein n=1 Tax=Pseudorhodobacter antarcticus TaxID=1077947 RepID=UPI00094511CC